LISLRRRDNATSLVVAAAQVGTAARGGSDALDRFDAGFAATATMAAATEYV